MNYLIKKAALFALFTLLCGLVKSGYGQLVNQGNLYISHGETVVVSGNLTNENGATFDSDGTLWLKENLSNAGTFIQDTGLVLLNGSSNQSLSGNNIFFELTLDNTPGAQVTGGLQEIAHTLTLSSGTFQTNDSLLLQSNATRTARIAEIPIGANIGGQITMERYLDNGLTGWHMLGSATSGRTLADWNDDFVTSGFPGSDAPSFPFINIYSYQESDPGNKDTFGYYGATNITNAINVGEGYWAYIGPVPLTLDLTGNTNTFLQSLPVTYTNNGNIINDGWNMVANPYPSNIDWDALGWVKTNVDNAIYFYDPDNGLYASYVSGLGTNEGSRYIASSQGFWVKCNGLLPVLSLTESVKTATSTTYFRKKAGVAQSPVIRLTVAETGSSIHDEMAFRFFDAANQGWDASYDAYKLEDSYTPAPYIATVLNDTTDLSINTLPQLTQGDPIPLRIKVKKTGSFTIGIKRNGAIETESCLVMEDLATGHYIDLKTDSSYTFAISDTVRAPRFLIHNLPDINLGPNRVLANGGQLFLKAPATYSQYRWSTGATAPNIVVSDTGWYWVEVTNSAGCSATDSIYLSMDPTVNSNEPLSGKPTLTLFPNPTDALLHLQFNGIVNEAYTIQLYTPDGQLVISENEKPSTQHQRISLNLNSLSTGSYFLKVTGKSNSWVEKVHISR